MTAEAFERVTTRFALELLFTTGVRVGELTAIAEGDVFRSDRAIQIRGKGDRERRVFVVN